MKGVWPRTPCHCFNFELSGRGKAGGGLVKYTIDALVVDDDTVATAWTAVLPGGADMKGLGVYRVCAGLIRSTRHAIIGELPT